MSNNYGPPPGHGSPQQGYGAPQGYPQGPPPPRPKSVFSGVLLALIVFFIVLPIGGVLTCVLCVGVAANSAKTTAASSATITAPIARGAQPQLDPEVLNGKVNWTLYDADLVKSESARNRPVFLDFTAAWCASCQTNDHAFIETDTVRSAFTRTHVRPIRCDMTNESDELDALLDKYLGPVKRNGIPAYIIAYPDGTFNLLPVTITADMVSSALDEAAKKYPADKYALANPSGAQATAADTATLQTAPDVTVTAGKLFTAYKANEVSADALYKGKTLAVTGTVSNIRKSFTDAVIVELATSNQFESVSANMQDSETVAAGALVKGTKTTVVCEGNGMVIGRPQLSDCVFADN
jgi:thiol-disulfide isomerase/thioredoxin